APGGGQTVPAPLVVTPPGATPRPCLGLTPPRPPRNRVWLAKRHLPAPLVPVYLGVWVALTVARTRSVAGLRAWLGGFAEGVRTSGGPRRPMRWRTVWRLARLGRPPVI
ncbi:hypothetical protein ACFXPJ_41025, partial [Streptomyces goshikiensis]